MTLVLAVTAQVAVGGQLPGDFNDDGQVGLADFTVLQDNGGSAADFESWKANYANSSLAAGLAAGGAGAGPTVTAVGVPNGGNIDWTLFIAPDEDLFSDNPPNGFGGSVATEISLEVADGTLLAETVAENGEFVDTDIPTSNPGNDPYAEMVVDGVQTYSGVPSVLDTGTVDAIFAPLGGRYFTDDSPKAALNFSTTGIPGSVRIGGMVAQAGTSFDVPLTVVTVVPEPATATLAVLVAGGLMGMVRRRAR